LTIRRADLEDIGALATVRIAAWRAGYAGQLPASRLAAMDHAHETTQWAKRLVEPGWTTVVAEQDDQVLGYAVYGSTRDQDRDGYGELAALYVHPDQWGGGVGSALTSAVRAALRTQGYEHVTLWVLDTNDAARRFYEHRGWRRDGDAAAPVGQGATKVRYVCDLGTATS